jgi:poly-gamma-glutamate capsule biosynthesis protein CapA/YwtB (metallophosphatase superfamily)
MMIFTGDLYIGDQILEIEESILHQLNNSNIIVTNFENVLENQMYTKRADKVSNLQFSKRSFDNYLNKVKSDIVFTLGNNHLNDLGQDGIDETTSFLEDYKNIEITGIGLVNDVIIPIIIEDNDKTIAILCVSTDEPEVMSVLATKELMGVLDYNNEIIIDIIKQYKKTVDYFVVIPHWGREYIDYPAVQLRNKAYNWIDAGADLIIGHHPHVIQGKEQYKGRWIYYSLGNFIFPEFYSKYGVKHKWKESSNQSIMLEINFSDDIKINEFGHIFKIKENKLVRFKKSLEEFNLKSQMLDLSKVTVKRYYGIREKILYKLLHSKYSLLVSLKNTIFNKIKSMLQT